MKKLICVLISIITLLMVIGPISAANYEQSGTTNVFPDKQILDYQIAIELLENYVVRQADGTFLLQAPLEVTQRISNPLFEEITSGMLIVNDIIIRDNLITTNDLKIYSSKSSLNTLSAVLSDGGIDKLILRWYGWDLYLSHNTILVIDNLGVPNLFLIIAIIALAIPGIGPYATLVGAVIYSVWGIIKQIDQGNGVILHFTPTFQLLWISRQ